MSPDDDLPTQRIPINEEMPLNRGWSSINKTENPTTKNNQIMTTITGNGGLDNVNISNNNMNTTNGKNGIHQKLENQNSWSSTTATPLLQMHGKDLQIDSENEQRTTSNNNDWSITNKPISREIKNGWKEVPQEDETINGNDGGGANKQQKNGLQNGGGGIKNGINGPTATTTTTTTTTNGHNKTSAELDPLTGGLVGGNINGGLDGCDLRKDPDFDEQSTCGIGSCQPKWARMFASTHAFMFVFLLAWVLQGMYYTYFVSVITTIEKLFQIKSRTTGLLMSATEIGQIGTALFLTYYAGRGHRPRWIACGMVLFAVSTFGCTIPHYLFGSQLLHASNAFYASSSGVATSAAIRGIISDGSSSSSSLTNEMAILATSSDQPLLTSMQKEFPLNVTKDNRSDYQYNVCRPNTSRTHGFIFNNSGDMKCENDILNTQVEHSQITNTVLIMFFISMLGVGIGQTAVSTLGIPYIDDNVASRESPIYIAITIGVRILGPAAGFILGSLCTRLYVDLSDPGITTSDPKWVGAWYLGLVIISSLMIITAIAMFTFPKHLKGNRIPPPMKMRAIEAQKKLEKQEEETKPQLKDFPKTIKRQLSNDILMFRTASSVLHLLPVAGLYTFLPKYLESQFRLTVDQANLISGIGGILVMGVGIVISGVVILKFSPTARSVAAYIAFTAIIYSAGMAILMFIGCSMGDFVGLQPFGDEVPHAKYTTMCEQSCECDTTKFSPICGIDSRTYFSACHAGCSATTLSTTNGKINFSNCTCITMPDNLDVPLNFEATSGYCDGNCQSFILFILLFSLFVFVHSTSEVGSMLLIMRCTDPKDKAMAMGIIQFAIGLFGNVPCPIIYGAVIDSTCLVWEKICGKEGACSLYDSDAFRHFFFGTTSGIMFLAFIMDVVVWRKAHRIDIDPEKDASETELEKPITTPETIPESVV